jgi:hypothetical protein
MGDSVASLQAVASKSRPTEKRGERFTRHLLGWDACGG